MANIGGASGVASGIQWGDMIDQIMSLEGQAVTRQRLRAQTLDIKSGAWAQFSNLIAVLRDRARAITEQGLSATRTSVAGGVNAPLTASASGTALPGTYGVRVLERATAERIAGEHFASRTDALNLDGSFLLNGRRIDIAAGDSLEKVAQSINNAAAGARATLLQTAHGHRLVLAAEATGAAGIDLADGPDGVLRQLGIISGGSDIKHRTSGGYRSDIIADTTTALGVARGLDAAGLVTFGSGSSAFAVLLDTATMSLADVRDAINAAAATAGSTIVASLVADGAGHRLDIHGTAVAVDDGSVLESLGVIRRSRDPVAQQLTGGPLHAANGSTPATAGTVLTELRNGSPAGGLAAGATVTLQGTRADGVAFAFDHVVATNDTLQTLLDRLNGAEGFDASAAASLNAAGEIVIDSAQAGASRTSLALFTHDPLGGSLDFGDFAVTRAGLARQLAFAQDATLEVDGVRVTSTSNTVTSAVNGVTFNLTAADPNTVVNVVVTRDTDAAALMVQDFINAYNAVSQFVTAGAGTTGAARPPLAGDSVVRMMRQSLRDALDTVLPADAGIYLRLGDLGIAPDRTGKFVIDAAKLQQALSTDERAVARIFGAAFMGEAAAGGSGAAPGVLSRAQELLGAGSGTIAAVRERLADAAAGIHARADALAVRLERRRDDLTRRFTAMENALARAQSQSQWLTAQLDSWNGMKR